MVRLLGGFYGSGDSFYTIICTAGYITNGRTNIIFTVPVPKFASDVTKCDISSIQLTVRQNGNYLVGDTTEKVPFTGTTKCIIYPGVVGVTCTVSSAPSNAENNSPVGVTARITFNLS